MEKLFGVTTDSNLAFEEHINSLCQKSNQKLRASWISQYLSPNKKRILFKTFVTFQFNDNCSLVWMCHSWTFNRINNIHHRALRILCQDKKSRFEKLLQKGKSVSVHMKNLQYLATETFKNSLSLIITHKIFNFQENRSYNLRKGIHLASRMHTAHFGTGTISRPGLNLWKLISDKIKHSSILSALKAKDNSWTMYLYNQIIYNQRRFLSIIKHLRWSFCRNS